ncbi:MAG TPA: TonB family protein [Gammaproteobacteria bacterium]|nr:TonB family protein [Gammaproteobacteria bacterium]
MSAPRKTAGNQGDILLWVAGGAVAAVGAAWLAIMKPWAGSGEAPPQAHPTTAPVTLAMADGGAPPPPADDAAAGDAALDNPLRMAQLAYEAGMLVEPEEYSAWTLYARAVKAEPNNADAVAGLTKVADDLVRRGETALEQGRFDDARRMVERIRAVLPSHAGAKALGAKIWPEVAPQPPPAESLKAPAETPRVARVEVAPQTPAKPAVDPLVKASDGFNAAMTAGQLLTPADTSAKHYLSVLIATSRDSELTQRARATLSRELLARAAQSMEAQDDEAATVWINEAESIGADAEGVRKARGALTERQVARESAKTVPASALKIVTYVAPSYPARAIERGLQGWVDVEFTVGTNGKTHDIVVTGSSNEAMFGREAMDAVKQWQFEPRVFMNRLIEQRSFTRIRFVQ